MAQIGIGLLGDLHPFAARDALASWSGQVWIAESPQGADAVVTASILRAASPQRPLGFAVLVSALRHPWATASACRALAASGGEVRLGIGVGEAAWKQSLGLEKTRTLTALKGEIAALRQHLQAPPARWEGVPATPAIPIYLGAEGPRMTTLAASSAEGLILPFLRTDAFLKQRVAQMKGISASARAIVEVVVGVGTSAQGAAEKLERWLRYIMKAPRYREVLSDAGLDDSTNQALARGAPEAKLPLSMLQTLCVLGTAEQCADEIQRRFSAWSDEILLVTPGRHLADLIAVVTALRQAGTFR